MSLARRLSEHFVIPSGDARPAPCEDVEAPRAAPAAGPPPAVAVLAAAGDAAALGAALGLALARLQRAPVVAVCVWREADLHRSAWRAPGVPAARRLAAALAARGHDARPAGRLVLVDLRGPAAEAAPAARRVLAATGEVPGVLALGGARTAAFDAVLADQDLVVVGARTDADPCLTRLALAGSARSHARVRVRVPAAPLARGLALAGVALLPSARRALAQPIAELS